MIDSKSFKSLQQQSARSYHQHKNIIKQLLAGKRVCCSECQQPLTIHLPNDNGVETGVSCAKGCTDIALDFS